MKLHILILSAILTVGCSNSGTATNLTSNINKPVRTPSTANKEESPQIDKEKESRVRQKIQEFITANYAGWTLKGTEDLAKSPLDLHIVKDTEEKVIKINYKEFSDLNGQPYIVISKIAQNDLSEENHDSKQTTPTPIDAGQRNEKNTTPSN